MTWTIVHIRSFAVTVMTPASDTRAVRAVPHWLITAALIVASVTKRHGVTRMKSVRPTVTRPSTLPAVKCAPHSAPGHQVSIIFMLFIIVSDYYET